MLRLGNDRTTAELILGSIVHRGPRPGQADATRHQPRAPGERHERGEQQQERGLGSALANGDQQVVQVRVDTGLGERASAEQQVVQVHVDTGLGDGERGPMPPSALRPRP